MPWLWCIYCTEWYGISESNSLDLEYLYLSILVGGHVAVELGEVEELVLHGLAGLLVVLGVVPDEGPVLVKVPHKVVIIIELAAMEVTPMIVVFVVAPSLLEGRGRGRMVLEGPGLLYGVDQLSDD